MESRSCRFCPHKNRPIISRPVEATAPLLDCDPTLWIISAWNDNGFDAWKRFKPPKMRIFGKVSSNVIYQPLEGRYYREFCGIFYLISIIWVGRICHHLGTARYTQGHQGLLKPRVSTSLCHHVPIFSESPLITSSHYFTCFFLQVMSDALHGCHGLIHWLGGNTVRNVFLPFHWKETWEIFAW